MFGNSRLHYPKQLCNLLLRQPHTFTLNSHLQPRDFVRLIHYNLTGNIFIFHINKMMTTLLKGQSSFYTNQDANRDF